MVYHVADRSGSCGCADKAVEFVSFNTTDHASKQELSTIVPIRLKMCKFCQQVDLYHVVDGSGHFFLWLCREGS